MRKLLIAVMVAVLAACGAVPERPIRDQEAELNAKDLCCEDLKAISYEPLVPKTPTQVVLDSSALARQFPIGRSYFKAFSISSEGIQGIWFRSYFNGLFIKQFLQPMVLFLDADHKPVGVNAPYTQFTEGNLFGDQNARMEGGLRVPPNTKYLLVFTAKFTDAPDPVRTAPSTGALLMGNTPVVTTNPGKTIALERSMTGELILELVSIPK